MLFRIDIHEVAIMDNLAVQNPYKEVNEATSHDPTSSVRGKSATWAVEPPQTGDEVIVSEVHSFMRRFCVAA